MAIVVPIKSTWDDSGVKKASSDIEKAETGWTKAGKGVRKAALPAAAALAAIGAAGWKAANDASDQEQSFASLGVVFKDNGKEMEQWAKGATDMGLSSTQAAKAGAQLGGLLQAYGVDTATAAEESKIMTQRAADMAATFGGPTTDAVDAMGAAFRGEFNQLEKYNVVLKKSEVNARLAAKGQDGLTGAALKEAEAMATLELIMEQTGDTQGTFASESDTMAGSMAIAQAEIGNASAEIGSALLPVIAAIVPYLADMAKFISENADVIVPLVAVVAAFAAAILVANAAMSAWATVSAIITGVNALLGASWVAALGPIALIIAAIIAVIAIGVLLYKNWDKIQAFLQATWKKIKEVAKVVWDAITAYFKNAAKGFKTIWEGVKDAVEKIWNGIKAFFEAALKGFQVIFTTYINIYKKIFEVGWDVIKKIFTTVFTVLKTIITKYLNFYKTIFSTVFNAIKAVVNTALNAIKAVIDRVMSLVKAIFRGDWDQVKSIIRTSISQILSLVRSLPGKILSALGNMGRLLYQKGKDLIGGLIDGVKSMLGALGRIGGNILDAVNPFSASSGGTPAALSPMPTARSMASPAAATPSSVIINVYESADGRATAARIKRMLEGYDLGQGREAGAVLAKAW